MGSHAHDVTDAVIRQEVGLERTNVIHCPRYSTVQGLPYFGLSGDRVGSEEEAGQDLLHGPPMAILPVRRAHGRTAGVEKTQLINQPINRCCLSLRECLGLLLPLRHW